LYKATTSPLPVRSAYPTLFWGVTVAAGDDLEAGLLAPESNESTADNPDRSDSCFLGAGEGVTPAAADDRLPNPVVVRTMPPVVLCLVLTEASKAGKVTSSRESTRRVSEWASHSSWSSDGVRPCVEQRCVSLARRGAGRDGALERKAVEIWGWSDMVVGRQGVRDAGEKGDGAVGLVATAEIAVSLSMWH
jgi:hypothetical protein